jgi:2'-5' RNA ligase
MLRVFFALWPDADARERLAALARIVTEQSKGRAPPPDNLHLTLAFVGEVPASSVATLRAVGLAAAWAAAPFTLTLDRIGTFRRTGIAWAGASVVPGELSRLAQCLADALASHDFPIEHRTFAAHVTLARRCRERGDLAPSAPIAWSADRIVLNVSEQAPGGPRYRELDRWPLEKAATRGSASAR